MAPAKKHPMKKFERQAPAMPALKRAAPGSAIALTAAPEPDAEPAVETPMPGFLSQKEVLLRLVETLKAL
jgi:hypothetical protein